MITVSAIPYSHVKAYPELLEEYDAECGWPDVKMNPQWDIYAALEAAGVSIVLGAFVDGVLAGFACAIVSILPHNGLKVATTVSLFVGATYRGRGAWAALRAALRTAAKEAGCVKLFYSATSGGRLEKILERRTPRTNSIFCESLS